MIASLAGKSFDWTNAAAGAYTVWFAHMNRSGIYSATPVSLSSQVTPPLGNLDAGASTTPHTVAAVGGIKFNTTGYIAYRHGGTGARYSDSGTVWGDATPPALSYKIRFDVITPMTMDFGSGTPSLTGTFGSLISLSASSSAQFEMSLTNGAAHCTVNYTLYDSTGTNQLESGLIFMSVESSD